MNKPPMQGSIQAKASTSLAVPAVSNYGHINILDGPERFSTGSESFHDKLMFWYGEYLTGILFIVVLSLYTILMPEGVTNPLKYVVAMLDKSFKKAIDFCGALLGIILALPVFILLPIIIKLDSRGPVFYTQDRVGVDRRKKNRRIYNADIDENSRLRDRRRDNYKGRIFKVIKFRTMVNHAESTTGAVWATRNDSRITRLGRFMRKSRLDEIPQLINVLKGDMSLVGPRPERPVFVQDFAQKIPNYTQRLRVRPGITGLAQVSSGYDTNFDSVVSKLNFDREYIQDWSISTDIKILFKTVGVVLTGKGAC